MPINAFNRLEEGLIALFLAGMTLLTFTQVVLRYVFNSGLLWALEGTTYLFAWMVLIGMSYGVRVGAHIGVDVIVRALPPAGRRAAGLLGVALALLYAGLMVYGATVYIEKMHMLGVDAEDIPVPRWMLGIILPISFGLLFIRLVQAAWAILSGKRELLTLADESQDPALVALRAELAEPTDLRR